MVYKGMGWTDTQFLLTLVMYLPRVGNSAVVPATGSVFELDVPKLRDHLNQIAEGTTGLSALRMYWYDAAFYSGPTPDHQKIAYFPTSSYG